MKKILSLIVVLSIFLINKSLLYANSYGDSYIKYNNIQYNDVEYFESIYNQPPSFFSSYASGDVRIGANITDYNATLDNYGTYNFLGSASIDLLVSNKINIININLNAGEINTNVNMKIMFSTGGASLSLVSSQKAIYIGNLETNASRITISNQTNDTSDFYFNNLIAPGSTLQLFFKVIPNAINKPHYLVKGNEMDVFKLEAVAIGAPEVWFSVNNLKTSQITSTYGYPVRLIDNSYMTLGNQCDVITCYDSSVTGMALEDNSTLLITNTNLIVEGTFSSNDNSSVKINNGSLYVSGSSSRDLTLNDLYLDNGLIDFTPTQNMGTSYIYNIHINDNAYITGNSTIIVHNTDNLGHGFIAEKDVNVNNAETVIDADSVTINGVFNIDNSNVSIANSNIFTANEVKIMNGSTFNLETNSTSINYFYIGDNTTANITVKNSGFNIKNDFRLDNSYLNLTLAGIFSVEGDLYVTNSMINVNGDSYINGNVYVIGGSKIKTGKIDIEGNVELELNSYNIDNFLFEVNSFAVTGFINVKVDTSELIKVGETYEYKVVKSNQNISPLQVNYGVVPDWISYNESYLNNEFIVTGERTKTYGQVLEESEANDFSVSLAEMIDKEMEDGVVSDNLADYIKYLDTTKNAEGLNAALGSNNPVDQEDFINYISKYSLELVENVKNNLNGSNFWVDGNYNSGKQETSTIDKGLLVSLGYNLLFNDDSMIATFFGGFSVGNLSAENYESDNSAFYFGVGLFALIKESEHIFINVAIGNNSFDTVRKDLSGMEYEGNNNYQNINIYGEYGIETAGEKILYKTNFYLDANYINMKQYKENSDLGYKYEDKSYGISNGGVDLAVASVEYSEGFIWQLNIKFGYQVNFGGSNYLIFSMDNSQLEVEDNAVNNSGIYVNPNIYLGYVFDEKNKINFGVGYEKMVKSYTNTMIKLMYTMYF